jgi:glutamine cyclotransferase
MPLLAARFSVLMLLAVGAACRRQQPAATNGRTDTTHVAAAPAGIPTYSVEIVNRYPHDQTAFTEGLEWYRGELYESTGIEGKSGVRREDLTGSILSRVDIPAKYFGEGITVFHGTLYELTWQQGVGFRYDAATLAKRGGFRFSGEGWGLTHDDRSLIMSDGTNVLRYLDPATLGVQRTLVVTAEGMSVPRLNELERIHGELWSNVWQVPEIARIDPQTGHVVAWLDLAPLVPPASAGDTIDVVNGIAYDSTADRIFVTGKYWPTIYQIRVGAKE